MIELLSRELTVAWPLLRDFPHKQDFIHSVYEGKQRGRIFVDEKEHPKAAVLFHAGGNAILSGDARSPSLADFLKKLLPPAMTGMPGCNW